MPSLFNTVGNLKFLNFISNQLPSGVPCPDFPTYEPTDGTIIRWIGNYVFASLNRAFSGADVANASSYGSSNYVYFHFPPVVGEPCENEDQLLQTTTSRYRFRFRLAYDPRAIGTDQTEQDITLNNDNLGSTTSILEKDTYYRGVGNNTSRYLDGKADWYSFGVASPSTIVITTFNTSTDVNPSLNGDYDWAQTIIMGWAHNSIYVSPPAIEGFRYNPCYFLNTVNTSKTAPGYANFQGERINSFRANDSNQGFKDLEIKYFDIACQSGSYSAGTFVTDLPLFDVEGNKFGVADNRCVCIGRGAFEKGRTYQLTNVFGRTGAEEWICVGGHTPATYSLGTWSVGTPLPSVWLPNELDYLLMRIYTEAD